MKINVLPQTIANMIAAGEVVERPASVVKELAENSVDAGAKHITIEIKRGGMSYIRVTDDGCGIDSGEVVTAFLRHATSKIKTEADLNSIYTLGFRGEALASIAAVAKVDIFTKTRESNFGYCVSVEGGEVTDESEAGCSDGTTITVKDLFFNTPARMKFLKSDSTETSYISDAVNKLILSHPEVAVKFISNGKTVASSSGDGKLINAIYSVYGRDYSKNMTAVDSKDEKISVSGYIGNSSLTRKDRRQQTFFLNGRYIKSSVISAALGEAFSNSVMIGRFPVAVLSININAHLVDVNVHPTKTEVRFSDEKAIYRSVYWAVKNALTNTKYIPEFNVKETASDAKRIIKARSDIAKAKNESVQVDINFLRDSFIKTNSENAFAVKKETNTEFKPAEKHVFPANKNIEDKPKDNMTETLPKDNTELNDKIIEENIRNNIFFGGKSVDVLKSPTPVGYETKVPDPATAPVEETAEMPLSEISSDKGGKIIPEKASGETKQTQLKSGLDFNIIGQVFSTYIIVQKENEMFIIDQHAAHERIYFEQLLEQYRSSGITSQILMLPITVDFTDSDFGTAAENLDFFEKLGFECDIFGEKSLIIRTVPFDLSDLEIKDTIFEITALLSKGCADIKKAVAEDSLHTMACKRAVKGGDLLTNAEMERLTEKVMSFESINTCPHGRPICILMSKYELEKNFKRIV